ncbi:hypothetical protein O3P69_005818 [Scylla paramamosain]|uniref:Ig-like domain-containing protein n=1 Tax=Scylla paramamosain TaxID=85552 RepID=A0AAW0U778_SCYPA
MPDERFTEKMKEGRPQLKVSWWLSESIIDDSFSSSAGGSEGGSGSVVSNTLIINPLTRAHAHSVLTCKAATAPVAVTTTKVTIDMYQGRDGRGRDEQGPRGCTEA